MAYTHYVGFAIEGKKEAVIRGILRYRLEYKEAVSTLAKCAFTETPGGCLMISYEKKWCLWDKRNEETKDLINLLDFFMLDELGREDKFDAGFVRLGEDLHDLDEDYNSDRGRELIGVTRAVVFEHQPSAEVKLNDIMKGMI